MMPILIREMTINDYDAAHSLWSATEHMGLNECDSHEGIAFYLNRNPGLSFVAMDGLHLIGTILCGHDGRRGVLRHLVVVPSYRGQGLGRQLIEKAMQELAAQGLTKGNTYVADENEKGLVFWAKAGFKLIEYDYRTLQKPTKRG